MKISQLVQDIKKVHTRTGIQTQIRRQHAGILSPHSFLQKVEETKRKEIDIHYSAPTHAQMLTRNTSALFTSTLFVLL